MITQEQIKPLADLITKHQREEWVANGYTHDEDPTRPGCAWVAHIHMGNKFARVDVGSSGKYMVDLATGDIYGVKAYGVVHRGHHFGTLATINEWYWGGYRGLRLKAVAL